MILPQVCLGGEKFALDFAELWCRARRIAPMTSRSEDQNKSLNNHVFCRLGRSQECISGVLNDPRGGKKRALETGAGGGQRQQLPASHTNSAPPVKQARKSTQGKKDQHHFKHLARLFARIHWLRLQSELRCRGEAVKASCLICKQRLTTLASRYV